jgi:phospholipid/cholesterol/gamma-HCH transport system ATP-binding protein
MTREPAAQRKVFSGSPDAGDVGRPDAPRVRKPGDTPIIRLVNVTKAFGPQRVLEGVNLDIYTAETTVIMGPSGCGKSVTLKHIVGLLRPDSGEVWFDGVRIDTLSERDLATSRLQIGLLFQMGALFDSMTVSENIEFPLIEHSTLSKQDRLGRVREALRLVGLPGIEHKLPSELSGGQRKRVALARAIILKPRVVLYDEPTTGLDPVRSDGINDLIIRLKTELNVTNIVVTHDLVSARKVADRVVMLMGGRVAADGTFDEVSNSPDPRVQHFLRGQYDAADDDTERPKTRDKTVLTTEDA